VYSSGKINSRNQISEIKFDKNGKKNEVRWIWRWYPSFSSPHPFFNDFSGLKKTTADARASKCLD